MDYIIVGQGLAGTLLGHRLQREGLDILLVDDGHRTAASKVAAGIMNPITGRRFVKSWMVDELFPFAEKCYTQIEEELNIKVQSFMPILRELFSQKEENEWLLRSSIPSYADYVTEPHDYATYEGKVTRHHAALELRRSGRVDIALLVERFRQKWLREGCLLQEGFDYESLEIGEGSVSYRGHQAKGVVFCEGYKARSNPYFSYLGYEGAKGEVLIVRIPDADFSKILKHKLFIVPMGNDLYWVGATNKRFEFDPIPTEENRQYLEKRLSSFLLVPYEVVEHLAAVRPTTKDRRPLLGQHPNIPGLWIFNGLGTKGASIGPYWADKMAGHLLRGEALDSVVDIARYQP